MLSKPCGRLGCPHVITATQPYKLRKRKYCSIACQVAAKRAAGWMPHAHLNAENRRRGGLASAKRTQNIQHRRKLEAAVRACLDIIPPALLEELSARGVALVKVLLGRAFELGRQREHRILWQTQRRQAQKGAAA